MVEFQKFQALGNDFIIFNSLGKKPEYNDLFNPENISRLCRAKYGIGADGIIILKPSQTADFGMKLYNPDGFEAELSGNGLRCLTLFIASLKLTNKRRFSIETLAGNHQVEILDDDRVKVWMPAPIFERSRIPMVGEGECVDCSLEFEGRSFESTVVSMGNPHCVIFEPFDVGQALEWGPIIERAEFFPSRTNVEFVEIKDAETLRVVVYERGAGITEACGSGACATVAAGIKTGRLKFNFPYTVELLGGSLIVTVIKDYKEVILEGEAKKVFEGNIDLQPV